MILFVAGLPPDLYDQELKELFEEVGKVNSARVILDRESGRSRCFGYVDMPFDTEAQTAIAEFNGMGLDDNILTVKVAEERKKRQDNARSSHRNKGKG